MSTPPYPHFPEPLSTQDFKDDDAIIIDQMLETTSAPADPRGALGPSTLGQQYKAKPVTRLYAQTFVLSGGAQPQQLLQEDVNRGTCKVKAFSTADPLSGVTYNDFCVLSDERGMISSGMKSNAFTLHHGSTMDLDGHTGQLWVIPGPGMSAAIEVSVYGITSMDGTPVND